MKKIKIIQVGMGPIGIATTKLAALRSEFELVGGIDVNFDLEGKDIGVLIGDSPLGTLVRTDLKNAVNEWTPDVAIVTTVSQVDKLASTAEELLKNGVNVVSSSEELLVPEYRAPEIAERLDQVAKENNTTIVAAGINPGFTMDLFPLFVSTACVYVDKMRVSRCLDAGLRRESLQKKVGVGLTIDEFHIGEKEGWIGHKGLEESIQLLCKGLGWKDIETEEILQPMIADQDYHTKFYEAKKGQVIGVHHIGFAKKKGRVLVELDLKMYAGAKKTFDRVQITGTPNLDVNFDGGIPGDIATSATLLNSVPRVLEAPAGLLSPLDLPGYRGVGRGIS